MPVAPRTTIVLAMTTTCGSVNKEIEEMCRIEAEKGFGIQRLSVSISRKVTFVDIFILQQARLSNQLS